MTVTADEHLRSGDLDGARAELIATVKRAPADQGARMFLFQLMCVGGEWDKAVSQLKALAQLSSEAQMLATVYGQAIEAERTRAAAFAGAGDFPVLAGETGWTAELAASLQAFVKGNLEEGEARRAAAFDAAPDTPGEVDGEAFEWIADADSRFGPTLEVILYGRWGLIPFEAIESLKLQGTTDLRDIVWLPAEMRLKTGLSAAVLLPARYPGSESGSADERLGRVTNWSAGPAGDTGIGQRLFAFDQRDEVGILALKTLNFR